MSDTQYLDLDLVAIYDSLNPLGEDSDYFLAACAPAAHSILDLGCGTGLLTNALAARGHKVVGVEPAKEMLRIAREHDRRQQVTWVQADAKQLDLHLHFDRIIASGHVFQVFASGQDQAAFLATAARHLTLAGLLIFDTRNPQVLPWRNWTAERSRRRIEHSAYGRIDIWHEVTYVGADRVQFRTTHLFVDQGRELVSESDLAFPTLDMVTASLNQAGLDIAVLHGDWNGSAFTPDSPEMIVTARRSQANL